MAAVDLDAVEAEFYRNIGAAAVGVDHRVDLGLRHTLANLSPRLDIAGWAHLAEFGAVARLPGGHVVARVDQADVPQLRKAEAAGVVHLTRDPRPTCQCGL